MACLSDCFVCSASPPNLLLTRTTYLAFSLSPYPSPEGGGALFITQVSPTMMSRVLNETKDGIVEDRTKTSPSPTGGRVRVEGEKQNNHRTHTSPPFHWREG